MPSFASLDVSSLISLISLTIHDYLTWTNFLKIMIIAFCINGLLLQTILVTVQYFSFETTVDLKFGNELVYTSFTICFPFLKENDKTNNPNYDELSTNVSNRLNTPKVKDDIYTKYKINHFFNNISLNVERISCSVKTMKITDHMNCDKPIESIENQSKCFTYSIQLKTNSILSLSANLSSLEFISNTTERARISIHSPKIMPLSNENEFLQLLTNKTYDISFWRVSIKQLPSPYTSCTNYPNSWSRFQCIHYCIINAIKNSCNCIPKNAFILIYDFDDTHNWCSLTSCYEEYDSFRINCNKKCSKVCANYNLNINKQLFYYRNVIIKSIIQRLHQRVIVVLLFLFKYLQIKTVTILIKI